MLRGAAGRTVLFPSYAERSWEQTRASTAQGEKRTQSIGKYDEKSRLSYSRRSICRLGSEIRRFICVWKGDFRRKVGADGRQRPRLHRRSPARPQRFQGRACPARRFACAANRGRPHMNAVGQPGRGLIGRGDADVTEEATRILIREGIQVRLQTELSVQGRSGQQVAMRIRKASGEKTVEGSDLLVAIGPIPNSTGLGFDNAGIELDERGYTRVNDHLQTTAPDVWAIGERARSPHFMHASVDDSGIVSANVGGGARSTVDRPVPHVVFTDPPLAHVGLDESEAEHRGIAVRVARPPMSRVLRTEATDKTQGFMKALVSKNDGHILGFTMIRSDAGEVMTAMQTASLAELPYQRLPDTVIAHLTMAESIGPPPSTAKVFAAVDIYG
jgi:hypothetical protein